MAKNNNTNQDGFTVKNLEKAFNNAGESRPNTFILSKKQLELLKKEGIEYRISDKLIPKSKLLEVLDRIDKIADVAVAYEIEDIKKELEL